MTSSSSVSLSTSESTFLLWVEVDGHALHGYQRQPNVRTVQEEVEIAWMAWQDEAVRARSSSRTDAGVHACRMPVAIRTRRPLPLKAIAPGLNAALADDISVIDVEQVPDEFHVRHDAIGKRYVYRLWVHPLRSSRRRRDHWHVKYRPLDVAAMRQAAESMVGEHDFSGFRSSHCVSRSTRRTLVKVEVAGDQPALQITVEGNAFLQNMVRIIVGTLVEVGRGGIPASDVPAIIESGDRKRAGATAPAHGLTLDDVFFGPPGARQGLDHKRLFERLQGDGG
jgi:tRNA pseudouridine38-40 synthase